MYEEGKQRIVKGIPRPISIRDISLLASEEMIKESVSILCNSCGRDRKVYKPKY
jgi:hypothetical protein